MKIIDALWDQVNSKDFGIISDYDLFKLYAQLVRDKSYQGQALRIKNSHPDISQFKRFRTSMVKGRMLTPYRETKSPAYNISGGSKYTTEDFCCYVDPFCYLSHFSALQRYRLTNRNPTAITLSTPVREIWNERRQELVLTDFDDPIEQKIGRALLVKFGFAKKIKGRSLIVHNTSTPSQTVLIRDSLTRLPTIGDLFVQTLEKPQWCGGILHVLGIWKQHSQFYLEDIITSVTVTKSKIAKVRAGYILEEMLEINDHRMEVWLEAAERGSSRKLDPQNPYMPIFSEKWMLSINV